MNAITPIVPTEDLGDRGQILRSDLSPTQQKAFDELAELVRVSPIVGLEASAGLGKSTILRAFANTYGGEIVTWDDVIGQVALRDSDMADESILIAMEQALERSDLVLVDGIEMLISYRGRGGWSNFFMLRALTRKAADMGRRIIFAGNNGFSGYERSPSEFLKVPIEPLAEADYEKFLANALGVGKVGNIDFGILFRTASLLSGHDLRTLAGLLLDFDQPTTDDAIACLESAVLECNTRLEEVEQLRFDDLPGTQEIAEKLETHIILPLTNKKLARELGIKPKRGVLIFGPPGTGKTSIGRALAHQMKGRLHVIDGSFITEPPLAFFNQVKAIVQEAKDNAPSVLFVDDADVLFGIEHISGLSRFLLSLLDGVESETAGQVCVMMTAMNVSRIPAAIMRSGRVELWLETKAPDLETRAAILKKWVGADLPEHDRIDFLAVAVKTEDFTPADLRRIASDARGLYGVDVIAQRPVSAGKNYLFRAIDDLTTTRAKMADNLRDESLRIGTPWNGAKYGEGIGGLVEAGSSCAVRGW